jgi:hypothetical protein
MKTFTPPIEVARAAAEGLRLRREYGRGGTAVGVARARDLSNRRPVSLRTLQRMRSYFARHAVDARAVGWGKDSAGWIAWLLWGGDAGREWATRAGTMQKKRINRGRIRRNPDQIQWRVLLRTKYAAHPSFRCELDGMHYGLVYAKSNFSSDYFLHGQYIRVFLDTKNPNTAVLRASKLIAQIHFLPNAAYCIV